MTERRDPVPESGKYYLRHAKEYRAKGEMNDAYFSLEQAYNHLENAAYHEAEVADRLAKTADSAVRTTERLTDEIKRMAVEIGKLKGELALRRAKEAGEYWCWQGDGGDHLDTLVCPVLIPASELLKLKRWCEQTISGLQHVAEIPEGTPDPLDLKHHALGSMCDEKAADEKSICIPQMFRKMFPDTEV